MSEHLTLTFKIDKLELLKGVQKTVCSSECPSVKKDDEKWTHVENCRALAAWLFYEFSFVVESYYD